jgi:hypothetical protein
MATHLVGGARTVRHEPRDAVLCQELSVPSQVQVTGHTRRRSRQKGDKPRFLCFAGCVRDPAGACGVPKLASAAQKRSICRRDRSFGSCGGASTRSGVYVHEPLRHCVTARGERTPCTERRHDCG